MLSCTNKRRYDDDDDDDDDDAVPFLFVSRELHG